MNILIGAGQQRFEGWIPTQKEDIDLTNRASFERFFGEKRAHKMVCEHVWEHLTPAEAIAAARHCFDYLVPGGVIRVAVPDGNFPDKAYQTLVQVGGPGPLDHPAADHKVLYTLESLQPIFENAGFSVDLLEYCDRDGRFHYNDWDWSSGPIYRSLRSDPRNRDMKLGFVSLIIDAKRE